MYRPTKKKLVRRVSVASVVAVMSATGLGIAFIAQSGATTSVIGATKVAATTKVATAPTTTKSATPTYHIVGTHHDDSRSSGDN